MEKGKQTIRLRQGGEKKRWTVTLKVPARTKKKACAKLGEFTD